MTFLKDVLQKFIIKPTESLPSAKKIDSLYDPVKVERLDTLLDDQNFNVEPVKVEIESEGEAKQTFGEPVDNKKKIDII
jgi:hypothetical protein